MRPARMMSAAATLMLVALIAEPASASGPWIAVFQPSAAEEDVVLAQRLAAAAREELAKLRRYPVLPRPDTEALPGLVEMLAEAGCWDRPACPAEVGGVVGARVVMGGQLTREEKSLTLVLRAFHVERGKALGSETLKAETEDELLAGLGAAVDRLVPAPEPSAAPASVGTVVPPAEPKKPAETKTAAVDEKPVESKPVEKKPVESKPVEKKPAVATAPTAPEGMPDGKSTEVIEEESKLRIITWIAAAGAAAMFGAGADHGIKNKQIVDDANKVDPNTVTPEDYKRRFYDPSWEAADRANIFLGVGGGMAAAAIVLFFVEPYFYGSKDDKAKAAFLPTPNGFAVSGTF